MRRENILKGKKLTLSGIQLEADKTIDNTEQGKKKNELNSLDFS